MRRLLILGGVMAATVSPALARSIGTLATLTGHCVEVMAMGVSTNPDLCANKLTNLDFANGRIGFVFVLTKVITHSR